MHNYLKNLNVNESCKNDSEDFCLYLKDVITNMMENFIPKIKNASNHIKKLNGSRSLKDCEDET